MIHLRTLLLFAGLAAAACEIPPDEPRMQQEALAAAATYDARLDDLQHRAEALSRQRAALPSDLGSAAAEHSLGQARAMIEDRRGYLRGVRARLKKPATIAELRAVLDELRHRLDDGITEATSDVDAVASWAANAARRAPAAAPPVEPSEPPEPRDDRAPETDRTGAPIR